MNIAKQINVFKKSRDPFFSSTMTYLIIMIAFVGLMLLGLSVAIICYALAQLIDQAAALKEEADLTV